MPRSKRPLMTTRTTKTRTTKTIKTSMTKTTQSSKRNTRAIPVKGKDKKINRQDTATQTPARGTTSSDCAAAGGPTGEALVRPQLPASRAPGGTPRAKAISSQPQKIKRQISSLRYEQHRYEQHTTAHKPQVFKQPPRAICVSVPYPPHLVFT